MGAGRILFPLLGRRRGPARTLPKLRVRGHCFEQETGARFTVIMCSDFFLYGRFLNGEDVRPVLEQRRALGFNTLRVWTRMQLAQYGIGDCTLQQHPEFYRRVPEFLALCESYGLYVEFTAYFGTDQDYDAEHWELLGLACVGAPNVLLELVNEWAIGSHRIDVDAFQPIAGLLCSHGSNGSEMQPVAPFWSYAGMHYNYAYEEQRKWGHNSMEVWAGPTIAGETSRCPDAGMWAGASPARRHDLAFDAAAASALLCAGFCFHSVEGKASLLLGPESQLVARACVSGATSVDLGVQDLPYERLDPGEYLRVYRRGWETVPIRP